MDRAAAARVVQFHSVDSKKPHYSHSSRLPLSTQQTLLNVMQRFDQMMLTRPNDAATLLVQVDILMRHVYGA